MQKENLNNLSEGSREEGATKKISTRNVCSPPFNFIWNVLSRGRKNACRSLSCASSFHVSWGLLTNEWPMKSSSANQNNSSRKQTHEINIYAGKIIYWIQRNSRNVNRSSRNKSPLKKLLGLFSYIAMSWQKVAWVCATGGCTTTCCTKHWQTAPTAWDNPHPCYRKQNNCYDGLT